MSATFVIKHQTHNRARLYCDGISKKTDIKALTQYIEDIKNVLHVRVNLKCKSIIIKYAQGKFEDIEKGLSSINIDDFDRVNLLTFDCVKTEEEISKTMMIRASAVLGLSPFIKHRATMLALSGFAAYPLFKEGAGELFREGITSRVLEASAVGISMVRSDFMAANSTNAMIAAGEYIEETTVNRSNDLIKELAKPNIEKAWVEIVDNGKTIEKQVATSKIKIGDIVVVNTGDTIPIDGHVLSENASINQVSMTGEAEPVKKKRGDKVMSGTIVEEGRLRIWAEQVGEDTATARIKQYIEASLNEKSSIGLKANELAQRLVPVTLGLAGVAYAINRDLESVASVLQADYSCALKLTTPVAFKSAISQVGKNGILIKGAKAIEALAQADTFVFDKTGTLTYGELEVVAVNSFDAKWSEDDILNLTASVEEHYFHPVAEAVVEAAKERGFVHMHHDEVEFIVAHGVKTNVKGKEVIIGSRHFLEDDEGISFKRHEKKIAQFINDGNTLLYVGYDGKLLGIISMIDNLRANAKATIKRLKEQGAKKIVMLTGDVQDKAEKIAKEVGIDTVYAELLPTEKAQKVKELKDEGFNIVFVGDGINDAPALMNADVGISMSRGADIAKATADISLLKDDIVAVAEAKELANETMQRIESNFKATVWINSSILFSATAGLLSPVATAVLHNGTTIGLLLSSMQKYKIKEE